MAITCDVLTLHNSMEHFGPVDTREFYPLRFAKENKRNALVYMPFGLGAKN